MTRRSIICALTAIAAVALCAVAQAGDTPWVLTSNGLGPIKIGMAPAKIATALGQPVRLEDDEFTEDAKSCAQIDIPGIEGAGMLFLDGRLDSIMIFGASQIQTPRGIGLGSTEAEVKARYAPLDIQPRDYQDLPAKSLTFHATPSRGIRFKTNAGGKVDEIVAGGESIAYMEGCA